MSATDQVLMMVSKINDEGGVMEEIGRCPFCSTPKDTAAGFISNEDLQRMIDGNIRRTQLNENGELESHLMDAFNYYMDRVNRTNSDNDEEE